MSDRPLLMIPGPIEISDAVREAAATAPPSHVAPQVLEAFGRSLEALRHIWLAGEDSQPFVVGGGGTLAMESVAQNLVDPGDRVVVVNTGYFGDRMAEMLRRRGAQVRMVSAPLGQVPSLDEVGAALAKARTKALFATHVDTSTGIRIDPGPLAALAREHGALSVFDGVCATAAERFEMARWQADVYLTASQKAMGLPPGLGLWVASAEAMAARSRLVTPPAMVLDWHQWLPIMQAYEARRPSYFSTPATSLLLALEAGTAELLAEGPTPAAALRAVVTRHATAAQALRDAWTALGLTHMVPDPALRANTLSALAYPDFVDASLLGRIKHHGAIVAGGLHPKNKTTYFRVGHMGVTTARPDWLERTVRAVGLGLLDVGHRADVAAAVDALHAGLSDA